MLVGEPPAAAARARQALDEMAFARTAWFAAVDLRPSPRRGAAVRA
jgi:hypothetical protein